MGWTITSLVVSALSVIYSVYNTIQASKAASKRKREQEAAQEAAKGIQVPVEGQIINIPVVYGRAKISGARTWHRVKHNVVPPYEYNEITRGLGPTAPPLNSGDPYYDLNPFVFTSEGDSRRLDSKVQSASVNKVRISRYSGNDAGTGAVITGDSLTATTVDNGDGSSYTAYYINGIAALGFTGVDQEYSVNTSVVSSMSEFATFLPVGLNLAANASVGLSQTPWFKDRNGNVQTSYNYVNYKVITYNNTSGATTLAPVTGEYLDIFGNIVNAGDVFSIADKPTFWTEARGDKNQAMFWKQVICWGGIHSFNHVEIENQDFRQQGSARDWDTRIHAFRNGNLLDPLITKNFYDQGSALYNDVAHATCVSWINRDDPQFGAVPEVSFQVEGMRVKKILRAETMEDFTVSITGTDEEFITNCYEDLLGRQPEPEGFSYWLADVRSGTPRADIVVKFKNTTEYIRRLHVTNTVYALSEEKYYSNNPALCLLDYLLNPDYGKGLSVETVDLESFYNAAEICGRRVQVNGAFEVPVAGNFWKEKARQGDKHYVNLYECNLVIDTSKPVRDNIGILLQTMGEASLIWSDGAYKLSLIYPQEYKAVFDSTSLCPLDLNNNPPLPSAFIGQPAYYDRGDVVQYPPGPVATDLYVSLVDHNSLPPLDNDNELNDGWQRGTAIGLDYMDITDNDIVLGEEIAQSWPATQERFNFYTIKYYNEARDFAEDSVSWPPKYNGVSGRIERSRDELKSAVVDDAWYRNKYPDLAANNWGASAQQHYDEYGWAEGRLPYENADVIFAGNNVTNAVYQAFLAEDNGVFLETEQFQAGDTSMYHAFSTAEGYVRLSRENIQYKFSVTREFLQLEPGDIVRLESDLLQVPGELMKITQVQSNKNGNLELQCEKYDCRFLAWNAKDDEAVSGRNIYSNSQIKQATNLQFVSYADYIDTAVGTNSEFVTECYRVLLGRDPEPAGLAYWTGEIDANRLSRADVIAAIRLSDEYKNYTANTVLTTVGGKLTWNKAKDTRVTKYQVKYIQGLPTSVTKGAKWTHLGETPDNSFEIPKLPIGIYTATVVATAASGETAPEMDPKTGSRWPLAMMAIGIDIDIEPLAVELTVPVVVLKQDEVSGEITFTQHPAFDGDVNVLLGEKDVSNTKDVTYSVVDTVNCSVAIDSSSLDNARGTYRVTALSDKAGSAKIKVEVGSRTVLKEVVVMAGNGLKPPVDPKPPTPANFQVDSAITHVFMEHDDPFLTWPQNSDGSYQNGGYKLTHWYMTPALSAPPFSELYVVEKSRVYATSIPADPGTLYHCWCTWEGNDGQVSLPAGPLGTMTGADVQKLLDILNDKITASQLNQDLRTWITDTDETIIAVDQKVDDLGGQYTVKIQSSSGGKKYMSGFGLANETDEGGVTYSQFLINADHFAVGTPTVEGIVDKYPFVVKTQDEVINGVLVPAGTYIQDAFIANGVITNAKIRNAAIDEAKISSLAVSTLKLQGSAVTVPIAVQGGGFEVTDRVDYIHNNTFTGRREDMWKQKINRAVMQLNEPGIVYVHAIMALHTAYLDFKQQVWEVMLRIVQNGAVLYDGTVAGGEDWNGTPTIARAFVAQEGVIEVEVFVGLRSRSRAVCSYSTLFIMGAKR